MALGFRGQENQRITRLLDRLMAVSSLALRGQKSPLLSASDFAGMSITDSAVLKSSVEMG